MIKDALRFITELKEAAMEPKVLEIQGKTYCNKDLKRYGREEKADAIKASTLTSLLDYIKNCSTELRNHMILHVVSPTRVELYSGLNEERDREELFISSAVVPNFRFDQWYDQERFIIELQANFEVSDDLLTVLKVSGNVEAKTTGTYGDDGVSQKTTIKQGIASKTDVIVPNPVTLFPYRTFLEVEQPSSQFVFRITDGGNGPQFKLIEAEGGLWKNVAMMNIKAYLEQNLADFAGAGRITIIA